MIEGKRRRRLLRFRDFGEIGKFVCFACGSVETVGTPYAKIKCDNWNDKCGDAWGSFRNLSWTSPMNRSSSTNQTKCKFHHWTGTIKTRFSPRKHSISDSRQSNKFTQFENKSNFDWSWEEENSLALLVDYSSTARWFTKNIFRGIINGEIDDTQRDERHDGAYWWGFNRVQALIHSLNLEPWSSECNENNFNYHIRSPRAISPKQLKNLLFIPQRAMCCASLRDRSLATFCFTWNVSNSRSRESSNSRCGFVRKYGKRRNTKADHTEAWADVNYLNLIDGKCSEVA